MGGGVGGESLVRDRLGSHLFISYLQQYMNSAFVLTDEPSLDQIHTASHVRSQALENNL